MKRLLTFLFVMGLMVGGALGVYISALKFYWQAPQTLSGANEIFIKKGMTSRQIVETLADAQLIDYPFLFRAFASVKGDIRAYKAGEYRFEAHASPETISQQLIKGKTIQRSITIPEGWISAQAMEALNTQPYLIGKITKAPAEGSILPETYFFVRDQTRGELLDNMRKALQRALRNAWENRAENLPFSTMDEALILASIVEKETGVAGERAHIASVFINRLRAGMPLQSDPTANYGRYLQEGKLKTHLDRADVAFPSPYNTYLIKGLPPAPICNPGMASIQAVLHPENTKDLYFVANGKGGHVFAATLREHNRNVAQYRKAMRNRIH